MSGFKMRRATFIEGLTAEMVAWFFNGIVCAVMIYLFGATGVLAILEIPMPTVAQALTAGFVISCIAPRPVRKYMPDE